jgi:hypothetical protein
MKLCEKVYDQSGKNNMTIIESVLDEILWEKFRSNQARNATIESVFHWNSVRKSLDQSGRQEIHHGQIKFSWNSVQLLISL